MGQPKDFFFREAKQSSTVFGVVEKTLEHDNVNSVMEYTSTIRQWLYVWFPIVRRGESAQRTIRDVFS